MSRDCPNPGDSNRGGGRGGGRGGRGMVYFGPDSG